ncbi:MAG: hypothetical protein ACK5M7_20520 [Draconibacterium sp.]
METAANKATELFREHLNYVSGWTQLSQPGQTPCATYEGEEMRYARASACARTTAKQCLLMAERYNVSEEIAFWQGVLEMLDGSTK